MKASDTHQARKALFRRGIQQGQLQPEEIEAALPPGTISDAERWLLYYSLHAAGVEVEGFAPTRDAREGEARST